MNTTHLRFMSFFLTACFVLLAGVSQVKSQIITEIAPSNVTLRGVSIADYNNVMIVGDSATILINTSYFHDTAVYNTIFNRLDTFATPGYQNFILLVVPPSVSPGTGFNGVSYYDTLHAIVIGDGGTILTTSDKGKNWSQQTIGSNSLRAITHITGSIFQIVGDGGTILRSTDNGATWSHIPPVTTKALNAVAFGSVNVGLAAGEAGTMLKTTDGGLSWAVQANAGIPTRNFYGVAMLGEDTATAVGDSALFRYTNDGTNWKTKKDSNFFKVAGIDIPAARNATLRAVTYTGFPSIGIRSTVIAPAPAAVAGGDGDLFYVLRNHYFQPVFQLHDTTYTLWDSTWVCENIGRTGDADGVNDGQQFRLNCMTTYHSGRHFLSYYAGVHGQIFVNVDSNISGWGFGINPRDANSDNFLFASFDSNGTGYATETGSIVRKTTDHGVTWKDVLTNRDVSGVYCQDSLTAFVAGWNGSLFRTTNGGVKWDSIPQVNQNRLHGFAFTSHDTGFCVGGYGTILRTYDGGATWQDKSSSFGSFLYAAAFTSPLTGIAVGDYATILQTSDGGETWTYNDNHPLATPSSEARIRYIQAFPDGTYFIGSDSGFIRSTDNGNNWTEPFSPPDSLGISFYDEKIGILGEYSTSSKLIPDSVTFRYTNDGGVTWPKRKEFTVPYYNLHRLITHWLDNHTFLLFGIDGFIMKVDIAGLNAVKEIISPSSPPMRIYPNPSSQRNVTVEYQTEQNGTVTIELWDELGKRISTLYTGFDIKGVHERVLTLNQDLHGTFFIRADEAGTVQTLRMIKL